MKLLTQEQSGEEINRTRRRGGEEEKEADRQPQVTEQVRPLCVLALPAGPTGPRPEGPVNDLFAYSDKKL